MSAALHVQLEVPPLGNDKTNTHLAQDLRGNSAHCW